MIAIDHYELFYLGAVCNEIFGEENRLGVVTVLHNPKGRNLAKFFSENSEFMLVYAKNISSAKFNNVAIDDEVKKSFNLKDSNGNYRLEAFMRVRTSWSKTAKPKNYYPIYISKDLKTLTLKKKNGYYEIFPKTEDGREWAWKNIPESFENLNINNYFCAKSEDNKIVIYHKYREQQVFKNVWTDKKYQSEFHGTNLLKDILGVKVFDYPKSLYLVSDILKMTTKRDSVILDFFAGSGTTGHAVLELNKEDKGKRQFILCTNNENNNGYSSGVAEGVCYPRIEKVMNGYTNLKKQKIDGLGGNLRYYKTAFVNQVRTDADKRRLVNKSTEMLCLTEDTFDKVLEKKDFYAVFENSEKITGIIYDEDAIDDFNKATKKLKKPLTIYVFSYDHTYNKEDFEDISNLVEVKPIPEVILNVYKKIYKNIRKLKQI